MALIIETGVGVYGANAYVSVSFVGGYLQDRNRATEWNNANTAVKEAAIIAATDYIESRFGPSFRGRRVINFGAEYATAIFTLSGLPANAETLTIGANTYKFVSALTGAPYEVLIDGDATATAENLTAAVNAAAGAGTQYGQGTAASRAVAATSSAGAVTLTAAARGPSGAFTTLQGTVTNGTITPFSGGMNTGTQRLSFPRIGIYDDLGLEVTEVPIQILQAVSEYASRAIAEDLLPDPSTGRLVEYELKKIGPLTKEVKYSGGSMLFRPYPKADRLVKQFTVPGGVYR
jgi:hypothetical protein